MGKGECSEMKMVASEGHSPYTWDEVNTHRSRDSRWIVIDDNIYDITRWQRKHPGGARIISHFSGQDATVINT